jgi:Rhodopirellula transposase DDE domain
MKRLQEKYELLRPELDERGRRLWAASEALALGRGGIVTVVRATGLSERTIRRGQRELRRPAAAIAVASRRVRRPGGGRKRLVDEDPRVVGAVEALVEPTARGDPRSPLRWTCKSTRRLAEELTRQGHRLSPTKVAQLLEGLGYSRQGLCKTKEGASHPDRNAQFAYINAQVQAFQRRGQPVVSVDTKKKELVGDFAHGGREYQPKGRPEKVRAYDFVDKALGKALPYGIYDLTANCGWGSVGLDHDTAQVAVATLHRWWLQMGRKVYRQARALLITADGGGSNGSRGRLWKVELQRLADETGLTITVCHFPPGPRKWHEIEHRRFCHITENWRGRPLINHEVIVSLIANTTTKAGLRIKAALDTRRYPTGLKVTEEQMRTLNLHPADFHGEDWNYILKPRDP